MDRTLLLGPFQEKEKVALLRTLIVQQEFVDTECADEDASIIWYRIADSICSWYKDDNVPSTSDGNERLPEDVLVAARIFCLSHDELYFLESPTELRKALNHRNEAASLSLIQQKLAESNVSATRQGSFLKDLDAYCSSLWDQFRDMSLFPLETGEVEKGQDTEDFLRWSVDQGICSRLVVGNFKPYGIRGCMAEEDIDVGDDILSIPRETLLYDETVLETDVGKMLSVIPGLSMDNLLILFTMIDRWDADSIWRPFWKQLPNAFRTGISFHPSVVDLLQGSAAYDEIKKAQMHIKSQYQACTQLFDILISAYPTYLNQDMFTYEKYVWAVELWYSYAFEIEFPPNIKSKTVMVPFACLVNHSPWPHVVRYGKMDMKSNCLRYPSFRPCRKGEQAFISYGPAPNMKLIAYYGFAIEENPHDIVPLTFEISKQSEKVQQALDAMSVNLDHNLRYGPLSKKLKACLRVLVSDSNELKGIINGDKNPLCEEINAANEKQAEQTLHRALQEIHYSLKRSLEHFDEGKVPEDWKLSASFCKIYLQNQYSILEKSLEALTLA